ncbi:TOBE domain-containing protein [Parathalassolituus penaei]|uniref:TOBE domain-containing protein n=1 Tax=Parathalassolituus penaei TaxID=2997323 RepID=A0A9X3EHZ1_9GAMM|nr:TOBE domain-containing protein [Parathalassolituus penaei]MCY0964576.1 TOBE domain-containing protein [Parathalassolituus penaei]
MTIKAINVRNQFQGTIKRIRRGDVVSEVEVDIGSGLITSIITTGSIDELGLRPGSQVIALFKSTEVALASFAPS